MSSEPTPRRDVASAAAPRPELRGRPEAEVRVLDVDLAALDRGALVRPLAWSSPDPALDRIGAWGGAALGLAILEHAGRQAPDEPVPLVVTAGCCVRRGLPTAARASVHSRAPLTGLLAEGQVGGELGPRLAAVADALVIRGRTRLSTAVLEVDATGTATVSSRPDLAGVEPVALLRALGAAEGAAAVLGIGPAGERGLPFASLASGTERPSFVGRGGLGAVLGRTGLKAIVVRADPVLPADPEGEAADVVRALRSSSRLAARATGGTFELFGAFAQRGELYTRNYSEELPSEDSDRIVAEARGMRVARTGCRGCPTPCGWVFERSDGGRQGAHFSAGYALGTNLGLTALDDALHLLGVCDRLGIDAKETGAVLAILARARELGRVAGPPLWGERERLAEVVERLIDEPEARGGGGDDGIGSLAGGAVAAASAFGLEGELAASQGQAARPEAGFAAVLGQCVSSGGADPMRSFPFLVEACDRERLESICRGVGPLPAGSEDPLSPAGKGRLVFWHENLVAAVDLTGFCAFSTAGLLADDVCDLDRLADWILPPVLARPADSDGEWGALSPGARLLAAGANLAHLRRMLDGRYGAGADQDHPAWARARLERPGMLDEYRALRGLDAGGRPTDETTALLGSPGILSRAARVAEELAPLLDVAERAAPRGGARAAGRVALHAFGTLERALGGARELERELPATVREVLEDVAAGRAGLRRRLFDGERPIPAVWCRGRRLAPEDEVVDGDVLELVVAIGGG